MNLGNVIDRQVDQQEDPLSIPEEIAEVIYNFFQLNSQLSLLLFLCPLSLIGLLILFAVRNLKGFGRWLGWTFIISGILTLFLIFYKSGSCSCHL